MIEQRKEGAVTIATVLVDLDGKTSSEAQTKLVALVEKGGKLAIDFAKVGYMSSAGLRVLLTVHRQAKSVQAKVVLVGVSEDLQDVMNATGFLAFFTLRPSLAEGLAFLG